MSFAVLPRSAWFGEGTVLKAERYRYMVQAMRDSAVAGLPTTEFHWLVRNSLGFNKFLLLHLNARIAQFMAARESEKMQEPVLRVARVLAAVFDPVLYPRIEPELMLTQQELAWLAGISRQRVNGALQALSEHGVLHSVYGGVRVDDAKGLLRIAAAAEKQDAP